MGPDVATIMKGCRFFSSVKGAAWEKLAGMALTKGYERGEMIFHEGEACPGVFVVGSGLVRIFKITPNGKEHVLHLVGPGGTFAEVAAIGGFDCPAFAEAIEETQCVLLPEAKFASALRDDHQLCLQLMVSMAGWVKHLVGLVEDITLRDAVGRVARYFLGVANHEDGRVRLPSLKKHLASHLNLTSETLSRTLRRLSDTGLVEEEAGELVVRDRKGLEELADGCR